MRIVVSLGILLLVILFSCQKDDDEFATFSGCSENVLTDSLEIAQKLIGDWVLNGVGCGLCIETPSIEDFDNPVIARFGVNGTYTTSEGGETIANGTWEIDMTNSFTSISLQSEDEDYFVGSAVICGDWLVSDASAFDGPAFYYRKVEDEN